MIKIIACVILCLGLSQTVKSQQVNSVDELFDVCNGKLCLLGMSVGSTTLVELESTLNLQNFSFTADEIGISGTGYVYSLQYISPYVKDSLTPPYSVNVYLDSNIVVSIHIFTNNLPAEDVINYLGYSNYIKQGYNSQKPRLLYANLGASFEIDNNNLVNLIILNSTKNIVEDGLAPYNQFQNCVDSYCSQTVPIFTPTTTPTPLPLPTVTPTPPPPPTATVTPAALVRLRLTSMCSSDPSTVRVWRVRNPNAAQTLVTWDVVGTAQTGSLIVPASVNGVAGEALFQTVAVAGSNTTRLFLNSVQQDVKASGGAACP